jgi:nucleoid-associated protein EbfC
MAPKPGSIGGNFQHVLRQAQKMQQQIGKLQEEHAEREFEGAAGGGMVKATVNGNNEVVRIDVDKAATDTDDLDLLLDLVAAAVNDGIRRAREDLDARTNEVTGGLKIPGLM